MTFFPIAIKPIALPVLKYLINPVWFYLYRAEQVNKAGKKHGVIQRPLMDYSVLDSSPCPPNTNVRKPFRLLLTAHDFKIL